MMLGWINTAVAVRNSLKKIQGTRDSYEDDDENIFPEQKDTNDSDLEKGGDKSLQHVMINVQGMTCSGCECTLQSTLKCIPAVQSWSIKTSLMLARAEFSIDCAMLSVDDVIELIRRKTSFKITRIFDTHGQILDVTVSDRVELDEIKSIVGVRDVVVLGPKLSRIFYDATVIGARDLIEVRLNSRHKLAPPLPSSVSRIFPSINRQLVKQCLLFVFSAMLTFPVLLMTWAPLPRTRYYEVVYNSVSLALSTIVQMLVVIEFYPPALRSLFNFGVLGSDLLVMLSTTAAYIFSVIVYSFFICHKPLPIGHFFETSTLLVTLILLGRFVSELSRQETAHSVSVRSLQNPWANLIVSHDGTQCRQIDYRLLQYGDIFRVPPYSRIVTDGVVVAGGSEVDESMITGEPYLVAKGISSNVVAGSFNHSGILDVRVVKLPWENTISELVQIVEEAELDKPKILRMADRMANFFVPIVLLTAIIVFLVQFAVGINYKNKIVSRSLIDALTYAISTLIVSCPCAIGLAVPMVLVIATGVSAKNGVVFKNPQAIEMAKRLDHVVFNKTGTLTMSEMRVSNKCIFDCMLGKSNKIPPSTTKSLLLGLISGNSHPVSRAVAEFLEMDGVKKATVKEINSLPGQGIKGTYRDAVLKAGNCRWLNFEAHPTVLELSNKGHSIFCFSVNEQLCAVFTLENPVRCEAASVVKALQSQNTTVHVVSGDDDHAAQAVARKLGIAPNHVQACSTPVMKQEYLKKLQSYGDCKESVLIRTPTVLFCGDGINDAPALVYADIGVHMSTKFRANTNRSCDSHGYLVSQVEPAGQMKMNEIAANAADVILVSPDLRKILQLKDISNAALKRIYLNFAWAIFYNLAAILAAAGVFESAAMTMAPNGGTKVKNLASNTLSTWKISPVFAALGEVVSIIPIIMIALSLKLRRTPSR